MQSYSLYQTSSSGEIESILRGSNVVTDCKGWDVAGVAHMMFVTANGLCTAQRDSSGNTTRAGFIDNSDLGVTIQAVCKGAEGTTEMVFLATSAGLFKVTTDSLFNNGESDRSGDCIGIYGTNNAGIGTGNITSIDFAEVSGKKVLVMRIRHQYVYLLDPDDSYIDYRSDSMDVTAYALPANSCGLSINSDGDLFIEYMSGVLYVKDAHTIAAQGWPFETANSNLDIVFSSQLPGRYNFPDYSADATRNRRAYNPYGLLWVMQQELIADSVDHKMHTNLGMLPAGDFDLVVDGIFGATPSTAQNQTVDRVLQMELHGGYRLSIQCRYAWDPNQAALYRGYAAQVRDGSSNVLYNESWGAHNTADGAFRIMRENDVVHFFVREDSGSFAEIGSGYEGIPTGPAFVSTYFRMMEMLGKTATWEIRSIQNSDSEITLPTNYSAFPAATVKGVSAGDRTNGAPVACVAYENEGATAFGIVPTAPTTFSFIESMGSVGSGKDRETLSDMSPTCVSVRDLGTGELETWFGTNGNGLDKVVFDPVASTYGGWNFDTSRGKTLTDEIACVCAMQSACYGTGAGASIEGAGYLIGDTSAPSDVLVYARGVGLSNVMISWEVPPETDRQSAKLFRRVNDGTWEMLRDDLTFGVTGTPFLFSTAVGGCEPSRLCFFDTQLPDGKYEYKVTQVDDAGNESSGVEVVEYLDEPNVTLALVSPYLTDRGVLVNVDGDSGDDSGNEAGAVGAIEIKTASQSWNQALRLEPKTAAPWDVPFYLAGNPGVTGLVVRGVSRSGKAGASVPFFVKLQSDEVPTAFSNEGNIRVVHNMSSDYITLASDPVGDGLENLKDPRLSKVWMLPTPSDLVVTYAFGGSVKIDLAMIAGKLSAGRGVYLMATDSSSIYSYGGYDTWTSLAEYKVSLTGVAQGAFTAFHRPERSYRYWAVGISAGSISFGTDYLSRVVLARDSDVWTPDVNFHWNFVQTLDDQSILHETEERMVEGISRLRRLLYDLSFSSMPAHEVRTARRIFDETGLGGELIVVPRPEEVMEGENAPSSATEYDMPPIYCQLAKPFRQSGGRTGLGAFDISVHEIARGEEV